MRVRVVELHRDTVACRTRLPFRFGAVAMTEAPLQTVTVRIRSDTGGEWTGESADLLVPRWFDKTPGRTADDDVAALVASVDAAAAIALELPRAAPFAWWWELYRASHADLPPLDPARLGRGFGVAAVERAMLDAVCRGLGVDLSAALRGDLLGFRPATIHPELEDGTDHGWLPAAAARQVHVRHTVGLGDALRRGEDRDVTVADGFPASLEDDIRTYGVRFFKLKIGAGRAADRARLLDVAAVLLEHADPAWRATLDANEQYPDLDELAGLLADLRADPLGDSLLQRLLYIEQPLPRHRTFAADTAAAVRRLTATAPLLIDEADVGVAAFPAALELGYRGVSAKSCKGVFRTLTNAVFAARSRRRGVPAFQSAEDLTVLPTVALQQDLAVAAALAFPHVERNGHHYFRGLDHLQPAVAAAAAAAHPDLYRRTGDGYAVRIEDGALRFASLCNPGLGR